MTIWAWIGVGVLLFAASVWCILVGNAWLAAILSLALGYLLGSGDIRK